MKRTKRFVIMALLTAATVCAHAFEFEEAVPLTIGELQRNVQPSNLAVSLDGNMVTVYAQLGNKTDSPVRSGYYAYTPLFHHFGSGEENYDKSFSDLTVVVDDKNVPLARERRAFFLGKDITSVVTAAGLDPMPSEESDSTMIARMKPQLGVKLSDGRDWEGLASYSWTITLPPAATAVMAVRYKALPQFGLEGVTSARLARLIEQHCGDAERVIQKLRAGRPEKGQVLVQRYVLPISFIDRTAVKVNISQPNIDWMGGHPVIALLCDLTPSDGASFPIAGTINDSDPQLSILVISDTAR